RLQIPFSLSVNLNIASEPTELNRNNVRTVRVNVGAMRWFDPDFSLVLKVVRAVYVCVTTRIESNCFIEGIVLRRECETCRIDALAANSIEMIKWRTVRIRRVRPCRYGVRHRRWVRSRRGIA